MTQNLFAIRELQIKGYVVVNQTVRNCVFKSLSLGEGFRERSIPFQSQSHHAHSKIQISLTHSGRSDANNLSAHIK